MRNWRILLVVVALGLSASVCAEYRSGGYPISQVPFVDVKVTPNTFWGDRIRAAREVTVPLAFSKCDSEHRYENFNMAAYTLRHPGHEGLRTPQWEIEKFMRFPFDDTDVYKTIEGASYLLQTYPDERLKAYIDSVLNVVGAAQEADGYLYTARTINPGHPHSWAGEKRWAGEEWMSHELYNLGHMVDAACAHYQATRSEKFLNIARRYADCVVREVGSGAGQACVVPGHQIAEMALARLYVLTGERKYLDEAKFLLDYRGKTAHRDQYSQSDIPVVEQREAWGHAVRAGYMYAGMADIAALTGDSSYIKAIDAICENIISRKYYITGGVGARHEGESFGADYELPNLTAYNETCAAISMVYLFHRMFLLHGDARYIDCMERTLYNGVISGMSVDGGRFFYPNPLSSDGKYAFNFDDTIERQPWFGCACCPSNLCRFIPVEGHEVVVEQTTGYPWNGDVTLRIKKNTARAFTLRLRIPGWVTGRPVPSDLYHYADGVTTGYTVSVNGQKVGGELRQGYLNINRPWREGDVVTLHFDMPVRMVEACRQVTDDRGRVAVERGPLVYCAEGIDNDGLSLPDYVLPEHPAFCVEERQITTKEGIRFQVSAIRAADVNMIPYYAWCHRGPGIMEVWMKHQGND